MDHSCGVVAFGNLQVPPSQPTFPLCPQLGSSSALFFTGIGWNLAPHSSLDWPGSSVVVAELYILVEAALAKPDAGNLQHKGKGCSMRPV